jgi:hypothetical protein
MEPKIITDIKMKNTLIILFFLFSITSNCQNYFWSHSATKPVIQTTIDYYTGTTSTRLYGAELTDGGANVSARGFCYSSTQITPTLTNSTVVNAPFDPEAGVNIFSELITGLTANTLYYWRAFETNPLGTSYGNVETFTTLNNAINVPTVTTTTISSITSTTASSGGNVTADGGASVTARGVCWNTTGQPDVDDNITSNGSGTGSFTSSLTGLTQGTVYFCRAYATNSAGVGYGEELSFTSTSTTTLPTVTTSAVTAYTTTATSGGEVTDDGGETVTARGVVVGASSNPTIYSFNAITTNGSGTGTFTSSVTGLTCGNFYYIRAYATNKNGTAYGNQLTFITNQVAMVTVSLYFRAQTKRPDAPAGLPNDLTIVSLADAEYYCDNYQYYLMRTSVPLKYEGVLGQGKQLYSYTSPCIRATNTGYYLVMGSPNKIVGLTNGVVTYYQNCN